MKLFGRYGQLSSNKILCAAKLANTKVDFVNIQFEDLKKKEFLAKNPIGKIPVLETEQGCIFESNAIMKYVAKSKEELFGTNVYENGLVDQWLYFLGNELNPVCKALMMPILGYGELNTTLKKKATTDLFQVLRILNAHLKTSTYMVGNALTIADLSLYAELKFVWEAVMDEKVRKGLQNLAKWVVLISGVNEVKMTFGKLRECKKEFPANVQAAIEPKKEEKKKPQEQPKKKETQKKKKEEEEDDDEIVIVGGAKKEKNPLDLLPPSPFVMDDFKRLYVNAPDKAEAFKYFVEHFDEQGYSMWRLAYQKAEGEGAVLFQTNNLMNGFLQRLESFRKYAFAVHGVYGDEPSLEVRGIWLWRGTGIPQEMKDAPSFEFHTVDKLDIKNEKDLKLVQEYWLNLDTEKEPKIEGLTARTVKYFK